MKTPFSAEKTVHTATEALHQLEDKARDLTDNVVQSAQSAVSATRDATSASIDKAQAFAERSINYCADTSAKVREIVDKYTESTSRYVTEQPGKSIAIAATVGAALALASAALLRRRGD